jgi:hypothetical protein
MLGLLRLNYFACCDSVAPCVNCMRYLASQGRAIAQAVSRWLLRFDPRSGHVGFVVDKVAVGQVFSEYFGFSCQSSFHRLLHNHHHRSSGDGTIGQQWPTYQLETKTKTKKNN